MFDRVFLGISMVLFVLGVCLPMFTLQKFFVVKDTFSLIGGIHQLWLLREYALAMMIAGFSIVTPMLKFALSWVVLSIDDVEQGRRLVAVRSLAKICKWSMADVFVIAILAATIKLGGLATVKVHLGLLFFSAYVLLSMILTHRLLSNYRLQAISE